MRIRISGRRSHPLCPDVILAGLFLNHQFPLLMKERIPGRLGSIFRTPPLFDLPLYKGEKLTQSTGSLETIP